MHDNNHIVDCLRILSIYHKITKNRDALEVKEVTTNEHDLYKYTSLLFKLNRDKILGKELLVATLIELATNAVNLFYERDKYANKYLKREELEEWLYTEEVDYIASIMEEFCFNGYDYSFGPSFRELEEYNEKFRT